MKRPFRACCEICASRKRIMNTLALCRRACSDPKIRRLFGGVFPSDMLPRRKCRFSLYVVNLDPRTKPGSHWIAIHFADGIAHYFDSYGNAPTNDDILSFLERNASSIRYNRACYQDKASDTCGHYCLYFLHQRARILKLDDLSERTKKKKRAFHHPICSPTVETENMLP